MLRVALLLIALFMGAAQAADKPLKIDLAVPVIAHKTVFADVQALVHDRLTAFENQAVASAAELPDHYQFSFSLTTRAGDPPGGVGSWLFEFGSYLGGAHGMHELVSRTYDLKSGKALAFDDIFVAGARKALARRVGPILTRQLGDMADADWIAKGTAPKADNWDTFVLDRDGVVFWFQPYQVAAFAAGPQSVDLGYDSLKDLLTPALEARLGGK